MKRNTKIEQLAFDADIITVDEQAYPERYPFHWHQFVECIAIVKSNATSIVNINQKILTLSTGDLLFIWPGEFHEIIDNSDKAIIALQFPLSLIHEKKEFATCYELYRENSLLTYKDFPLLNDSIYTYLQNLFRYSKQKSDTFLNIKMTMCLYNILICIADYTKTNSTYCHRMKSESNDIIDKISLACSYITDHCTEHLTLDDAASYVGFSPCYFSRHFKNVTTHSFVEYLNIQRINKLQTLLSDPSISITDAAYKAGFKSISTMNRVFARHCSCSPRDFRNYLFL